MKNMFKNQRGVTLIILIVTILVMIIIAAIAIRQGLLSVSSTQDSVIESNLKIVQQAILQEHSKANVSSEGDSDVEIGTKQNGTKLDNLLKEKDANDLNLQKKENPDSYFVLDKDDLDKMGVEVPDGQEYLVDYETGEVWDITNNKYQDDTYAYLSGVTNDLKDGAEKFSDASIDVTLEKDWEKNGDKYVLKLKVKDDSNEITKDGLNKDDIDKGRLRVEINGTPVNGAEVKFTPTGDEDGNHTYDVEIKIPKSSVDGKINGSDVGNVKVTIDEKSIIDDGDEPNEKTEFASVLNSDKGTGTIHWDFDGEPKYETKLDFRPNGYTDSDGKIWGTAVTVDIKLSCDNVFDDSTYVFYYWWGQHGPLAYMDNGGKIYVNTKKGQKSVKASIYLDGDVGCEKSTKTGEKISGTGRLFVTPAENYANFESKNSSYIYKDNISLDNEPPYIETDFLSLGGRDLERPLGIYNEDDFTIKDGYTVYFKEKTYSNASAYIKDEHSGLCIFGDNNDKNKDFYNLKKIYNIDNISNNLRHSFALNKSNDKEKYYIGSDMVTELQMRLLDNTPKKEIQLKPCFVIKNMKDYVSGEYYIWTGNIYRENDILSELTDSVGNPIEQPYVDNYPIKIDFHPPVLESGTFNDDGNAVIVINDDYSGQSKNIYNDKKIRYKWYNDESEISDVNSLLNIEDNSEGINRNYTNGDYRLQKTVNITFTPPSDKFYKYLYIYTEGYEDVAGNPMTENVEMKIENPKLDSASDLKINVTESVVSDDKLEKGSPVLLSFNVTSESSGNFYLKDFWYEHKGFGDRITIPEEKDAFNTKISGSKTWTKNTLVNGPIIVHAVDYNDKEYTAEFTVTKVQETILEVKIDSDNKTMVLPFYFYSISSYFDSDMNSLMYIDWGDGNKEYISDYSIVYYGGSNSIVLETNKKSAIHTYEKNENLVDIKFSGPKTLNNNWDSVDDLKIYYNDEKGNTVLDDTNKYENILIKSREAIIGVKQFGIHKEASSNNSVWSMNDFYNLCTNLEKLPYDYYEKMPEDVRKINQLAFVDVGGTRNNNDYGFARTFKNTSISRLDSSMFVEGKNIKTFDSTFMGTKIKTIPENIFSQNTRVNTFYGTFQDCVELTEITNVDTLFQNNEEVTSFSKTFCGCTNLKSITGKNNSMFWKNIKAINFIATFKNCKALTEIPENLFTLGGNFGNFPALDFTQTFMGCFNEAWDQDKTVETLTSIPSNLFKTSVSAENFTSTFQECGALAEIPKDLFSANVEAVDFTETFRGCKTITEIDEKLFSNNIDAEEFDGTFRDCTSLKYITHNLFWRNRKANTFAWTFANCDSLTEIPHDLFIFPKDEQFSYPKDKNGNEISLYDIYEYDINKPDDEKVLYPSEVTTFAGTFWSCGNIQSIPYDIFAASKEAIIFNQTFEFIYALKEIPDDLFKNQMGINEKYGLDFHLTFAYTGITNVDSDFFSTDRGTEDKHPNYHPENVTQIWGIFSHCGSLKYVNYENGKQTSDDSIDLLFAKFTEIDSIDIIFEECTSLEYVPSQIFEECEKVKSMKGTFYNCKNLTHLGKNAFDAFDENFDNEDIVDTYRIKGINNVNVITEIGWNSYGTNVELENRGIYTYLHGVFGKCEKLPLEQCPEIWNWGVFKTGKNAKMDCTKENGEVNFKYDGNMCAFSEANDEIITQIKKDWNGKIKAIHLWTDKEKNDTNLLDESTIVGELNKIVNEEKKKFYEGN